MTNQPAGGQAKAAASNPNSAEPLFTRVLSDLRQHRPQLAERLQANSAVLERVRDYEKQTALVVQQVTLAAAKGEDIERLALLDPVTELYNHRAFIKELKAEMARAKRYKHPASLTMISIDGFDDLSRQYGQLTCDALQKIVSHAIRSALREVDVACKYSDYNYAIILPQTNAAGAALVGERIRQRVGNQAIVHNWHNFSVTCSVGVATFPEHAAEYDLLIACAIEALDTALVRGGDRVVSV